MTEIHKNKVTAEEWQKALDGLKVGDIYQVDSFTTWNKWEFDKDDILNLVYDAITAIRKASQPKEQAEAIKSFCALSCSEQIELQEELAKLKAEKQERVSEIKSGEIDLGGILAERGAEYGSFTSQAAFSQYLKDTLREHKKYDELMWSQKEALEMIMHKIARILNGDPNYDDSWRDIAGYAELIVKELNENTIKG